MELILRTYTVTIVSNMVVMNEAAMIVVDENIDNVIAVGNHIVEIWAPWNREPRILTQGITSDVHIHSANIDECGVFAERYAVVMLPALLTFKDGILVDKKVGLTFYRPRPKRLWLWLRRRNGL